MEFRITGMRYCVDISFVLFSKFLISIAFHATCHLFVKKPVFSNLSKTHFLVASD